MPPNYRDLRNAAVIIMGIFVYMYFSRTDRAGFDKATARRVWVWFVFGLR